MPQVSYAKSIDWWTGFCMAYGALAILETAIVAYLIQGQETQVDILMHGLTKNSYSSLIKHIGGESISMCSTVLPEKRFVKTMMLDKVSRVLFPAGFLMFIILYTLIFVVGNEFIEATWQIDNFDVLRTIWNILNLWYWILIYQWFIWFDIFNSLTYMHNCHMFSKLNM